ncbi:hypothetical protein PUNSTDRAFT_41337 [Punctularia strigosozonata HHB-11173 SS5]|uniref:uncharacterized protein n=1 Tax=Punctularia strigosozonata (strain HHB-11173) TaxID=741275 RepID=UPI0004416CAD|nr:uncharacterized protein PUNSTDRAFT_41337 [Punctularia strigosozonata HHB-11173 SS5]EIN13962.1 hypothetical protein PUNSTDRAFT_41337 [Punctularia strigosozonata HHB-11173 SS5]
MTIAQHGTKLSRSLMQTVDVYLRRSFGFEITWTYPGTAISRGLVIDPSKSVPTRSQSGPQWSASDEEDPEWWEEVVALGWFTVEHNVGVLEDYGGWYAILSAVLHEIS